MRLTIIWIGLNQLVVLVRMYRNRRLPVIRTICFLLIFVLYSCTIRSKKDVPLYVPIGIPDTIKISLQKFVRPVDSDQFYKTIEYVPLETTPISVISEISRVVIVDDLIFILDLKEQAVQIFSRTGIHRARIQNIGRGPAEYQSIIDLTVDESTKRITLLSDRPSKFFYYDYNGMYIDEENLESLPQGVVYSQGQRATYYDFFRVESERNYALILRSPGKEDSVFFPFNKRLRAFALGPRINASLGIHTTVPHEPRRIIRVSGGEVSIPYYLDFGTEYLDPSTNEDYVNQQLMRDAIENLKVFSVTQIREYEGYLSFSTNIRGLILFNKETRESNYIVSIRDINTGIIFANYKGHQGLDNNMVYSISSREVIDFIKHSAPSSNEAYSNLRGIAADLKEDDNPVLVICTLK